MRPLYPVGESTIPFAVRVHENIEKKIADVQAQYGICRTDAMRKIVEEGVKATLQKVAA